MSNGEFKIGDVVKHKDDGTIAVVTRLVNANDWFIGMDSSGSVWCRPNSYWENTGEHINIQSVLDEIKRVGEIKNG